MSNPNEDSKETQFSSNFARFTAGQLTTDEQKALVNTKNVVASGLQTEPDTPPEQVA